MSLQLRHATEFHNTELTASAPQYETLGNGVYGGFADGSSKYLAQFQKQNRWAGGGRASFPSFSHSHSHFASSLFPARGQREREVELWRRPYRQHSGSRK